MKLVYITNSRIPTEKAYGYQICKMCEEFASAGIDVELLAPTRMNEIRESANKFYNLQNNFSVTYLKLFDFFRYEKILGSLSFFLNKLWFLTKLFFIRFDKNDLVYSRTPEIIFLLSLKGHKCIYECHSWPGKNTSFFKFFSRYAYKIIVTTNQLKNIFLKAGFAESSVLVAPDGVDFEAFNLSLSQTEARAKLNLPRDKTIVGYTGSFKTMGEDKGINDILKALKHLNKSSIYFVAVGGNAKDIEFYQSVAKSLQQDGNVKLVSRVSLPELALYQQACDVLLMPFPDTTHYRDYMSPLKMFEYMASNRPIIASDLPSIREVLTEMNCVFVKPDSPEDLAKKITLLIEDKTLGKKLSAQALMDVQKYTWKARARGILDFLD